MRKATFTLTDDQGEIEYTREWPLDRFDVHREDVVPGLTRIEIRPAGSTTDDAETTNLHRIRPGYTFSAQGKTWVKGDLGQMEDSGAIHSFPPHGAGYICVAVRDGEIRKFGFGEPIKAGTTDDKLEARYWEIVANRRESPGRRKRSRRYNEVWQNGSRRKADHDGSAESYALERAADASKTFKGAK